MKNLFFYIVAMVLLFGATVALAGEQVPRAVQGLDPPPQKMSDEEAQGIRGFFLPPHIVAKQELAEIREEWSAQELGALISKREDSDD